MTETGGDVFMEANFAGGCFWCIAEAFRTLNGVEKVISGYAGGDEPAPTYEEVKHQKTGHRETVHLVYDEAKITFSQLLDVYFRHIDPFDEGGQFIDRGHSYTCAVYYANEEEKAETESRIRALESGIGKTVFVSVEPMKIFYPAEEYHQDFAVKNPEAFRKEQEESGRLKLL